MTVVKKLSFFNSLFFLLKECITPFDNSNIQKGIQNDLCLYSRFNKPPVGC